MMLFETLLSIFKLCLAISVQDDEHTNQTTLYMEPCYYNNEPNVRIANFRKVRDSVDTGREYDPIKTHLRSR